VTESGMARSKTDSMVHDFAGGAAGAAKEQSAFRGPIGLEYGSRNLVRGPGAFFFYAGVAKMFSIVADRLNQQFRADAFNLFNHPNFGPPLLNIVTNASASGQITGTNQAPASSAVAADDAGVGQFALRLEC
jgi:hypothetical protein